MKKQSEKLFLTLALALHSTNLFGAPHTVSQSASSCAAAINQILIEIEKIKASLICSAGSCPSNSISQKDFDDNGGVYVITHPGTYTLSENIESNASGDGIIIVKSSFVNINLCGHKLTGNGTSPALFLPENSRFITITNGVIENCTYGVQLLTGSGAITCSLLDFIKISEFGISLQASGQCFIRGCTFTECGNTGTLSSPRGGIEATSMRNVLIDGCIMRDFNGGESVVGIIIEDSVETTISRFIIQRVSPKIEARGIRANKSTRILCNTGIFYEFTTDDQTNGIARGIDIAESSGILVRNAVFANYTSGTVNGCLLTNSSEGLIDNCSFLGGRGQGAGFELFPAQRIVLRDCAVQSCNAPSLALGCAGFSCESGNNNILLRCITNNVRADEAAIGIRLAGETASLVEECTIRSTVSANNLSDGILLGKDRNTGAECIGCVVERCSVSYTEGPRATSYRDTSDKSENYFSENRAFIAGINYSVNYSSGPLPTALGSVSAGFPALSSTGAFDNLDMQS